MTSSLEPAYPRPEDADSRDSSPARQPYPPRRSGARRWLAAHRHAGPVLIVVTVVLLANGPYLSGVFSANPVFQVSGLQANVRPGVPPGAPTIDPNFGFMAQAVGHRAAVDWLHGHVPWWNPYEGVGMPLAGNMQSGAFFPLVPLLLLPNGLLFMHIVLEAVAGVGTYLLLRKLGLGAWPATAAGAAFALNGTFSWFAIAPVQVIAFLPLTLLGLEHARDAALARRRMGWVLLAASVALSLYAGFPETAYIDGLLVGLWLLARLIQTRGRAAWRLLLKSILGATAGLALSAPIVVAFLDDLRHANVGPHGGVLAHTGLVKPALAPFTMPYFFGPIFGFTSSDHSRAQQLSQIWGNVGGYLTTSLVLLAVIGLLGRRDRALRLVLGGWVVLSVARTYGATWTFAITNIIPGVDRTAFYRYAPVAWEFAVVVLAAYGIDDLVRAESTMAQRVVTLVGAAGATLAIVALGGLEGLRLSNQITAPHVHLWRDASVAWAIAVVVAAAGAALLPRRGRLVLLAAIIVVDASVPFVVPELSAPRSGRVDEAPVAFLRSHLGLQRVYALGGPLLPNYGSYFGVAQINQNDLPIPQVWSDYVAHDLDTNENPIVFTGAVPVLPPGTGPGDQLLQHLAAYEAIGVKYVLAAKAIELPAPLTPVWSDDAVTIYQLPNPAPYFEAVSGSCTLTPRSRTSVVTSCPSATTLVRRELDEPGWNASASHRTLGITRYQGLLQAVHIPAGTHVVDFDFSPPHTDLAILAGAACLAAILLGAALAERERRRLLQSTTPGRRKPSS